MNLLGNLFGSLTSGLIRLAVSAAILLLCYLFIVKPVLNSTSGAIKSSGIEEIGKTFDSVSRAVQGDIRKAFRAIDGHPGSRKRLVRCINRSHGNARRIRRCTRRF